MNEHSRVLPEKLSEPSRFVARKACGGTVACVVEGEKKKEMNEGKNNDVEDDRSRSECCCRRRRVVNGGLWCFDQGLVVMVISGRLKMVIEEAKIIWRRCGFEDMLAHWETVVDHCTRCRNLVNPCHPATDSETNENKLEESVVKNFMRNPHPATDSDGLVFRVWSLEGDMYRHEPTPDMWRSIILRVPHKSPRILLSLRFISNGA
ncbi:hypothetical protein PIB30_070732 [Stylosanthes scabra]|uniref:Integrase zinc-binding domain-containing protein n=1 Tax=Stylosanthes scabra TaxID=79078 RepID=A0ABU6WN74_9FABA|nr:hypothetical protein [Stylosanthes scabra]